MPRNAEQDENQQYSILGVGGTAGTADTAGTSRTVAVSVNPDTGAMYVQDLSGASGTTNIAGTVVVSGGTINAATATLTGGTLNAGTVVLNGGTAGTVTGVGVVTALTSGTVSVNTPGTITSGTVTTNQNSGTLNVGTINSGTINNGTLTLVTTVSNLTAGSVRVVAGTEIITSGTVDLVSTVTTLSNLTNGSVKVTAGTVNTGTINTGTVGGFGANAAATVGFPVLTGGMDSGGTTYTFLTDTTRRIHNVMQVGTLNAGTINTGTINSATVNAGTFTMTVGTLNSGTINSGTINTGTINAATVNTGTINSGTINAGTITRQPYPASQVQSAFAVGTGAIGTLVSAVGAGTGIYVNSIIMTPMSGTLDMCLSFGLGSTTNQVVARGYFVPGGGIVQSFDNPSFYGTANSALTYQILGGSGTAVWQVNYNSKGTP